MPSTRAIASREASETAVDDPRDQLAHGLRTARAGEIATALDLLDRAGAAEPGALSELEIAQALTAALDCRLARGELPQARGLGGRLEALAEASGRAGATALHGLGELSAAATEVDLAWTLFTQIPRRLDALEDDPEVLPWRTSAALAAVRLGHRTEGTALAREHLALAGSAGAAYSIALGLRTLATVDAHTDRASLLRQALDELDGVPAARLTAQVSTDLAGLLLLGHDPRDVGEAHDLLRAAERYAGHQGLWPLLSRIRRLLDRMGEQPRPVRSETLAVLTAAEQRVARLAATGLTNREIAGRLVVTVKAVEWHLSHVYRKLGIRSRGALVGALGPGV